MKRILFTILAICLLQMQVAAAERYRTMLLERIGSYLPRSITESQDTLVRDRSFPCTILKRSSNGTITHLGFQIFNNHTRSSIPVIADFIERYLLEVYQQKSENTVLSKLSSQHCQWKENGRTPQNVRASILQFLQKNNKSLSFKSDFTDAVYTASWTFDSTTFSFSFPAERQLIYGTDIAESEEDISKELKQGQFPACKMLKVMPLSQLKKLTETMYRQDGLKYKVQDRYTTDTYYEKVSDTEAQAYSNRKYPEIVLLNMVSGIVPCDNRRLDLSFHRYGGVIEHHKVPLSVIYSPMFADTQCYFYVDTSDASMYYARMIYCNELFQYVHVIEVSVPPAEIFSPNATWKAHLYCNIPQHNLKNIIKQ